MAETTNPPERKGLRRRDKVLIGCALGCGGFVILSGLAFFGGLYWLVSPGNQIATKAILSERSFGYIRMPDPGQDPGLSDLMTTFLLEASKAGSGGGDQGPRGLLEKYQEMNLRSGANSLRMWLPKDVTISFETTPDRKDVGAVAAVNLRSFPRAIRAFISSAAQDSGLEYRGQQIFDMGDGDSFIAFYGSTLLVSSSKTLVERVIDRLEEASEGTSGVELEVLPSRSKSAEDTPPGDVFGAFDGASGVPVIFLQSLLGLLPPSELPEDDLSNSIETSDVKSMRFGLDIVTADTLRGGLTLDFDTEASAARWTQRFTGQGPIALGDYQLAITMNAEQSGPQVQASFELTGLKGLLTHFLELANQVSG